MTQTYSTCPECSHTRKKSRDKCLSTNVENGLYLCHHCGYSGINGGGKEVANRVMGFSKARPELEIKAPLTDLPERVLRYFDGRGIPESVLTRNKIGFRDGSIMFPYLKDGKIVNAKYRTNDKRFRQETGAEKIFYGLDDIGGCEEIIIVEGEIDKLSFEVAGYENVLSVPDGAPSLQASNYESKFSYIANCEEELEEVRKIILAVDSDAPGRKLEAELIRRLGPERCWRVTWPEGCKDANDVLVKHGEFKLLEILDSAQPVPVAGLFSVADFREDIITLYENGMPGGESTSWFSVDSYYTVRQGELTIVTGIPGHGKSELIDALMINLAVRSQWGFAVFSPENYPIHAHIAKLVQKFIGKPFGKGYQGHMGREELLEAQAFLDKRFSFISPPDDELTVDHIISKAKVAVMRFGIKGMCIDPWNELDHSRPPGKTETEYISECLTKTRRFARSYKVHVWLIAHPVKLQRCKDGKYPIPSPYDISGSAHFRNKADNCLCVWRDLLDEGSRVQVHVQKIRFKEVGKVGKAELDYEIKSGRYVDTPLEPLTVRG